LVLFDLSSYDLSLKLEKINDDEEYKFGDKLKGEVNLRIKKSFHAEGLFLQLIKESQVYTKNKLEQKDLSETKTIFLYNDMLDNINNYNPEYKNFYHWDFNIFLEDKKESKINEIIFAPIYEVTKKHKYYLKVIFKFRFRKDEIIIKELKIKQ